MSHQGALVEHQVYPSVAMPLVGEDRRVTKPWQRFFQSLWQRTGGAISSDNTGFVFWWAGQSAPNGYLLCDGSAVSRTTYAALFSAIGTANGEGDGKTTFNLPNLIDKFARGGEIAGKVGGQDDIIMSIEQLPAHSHSVVDPSHTHAVTDPGHHHTAATISGSAAAAPPGISGATAGNTGDATTGITINAAPTGITIGETGENASIPTLPSYATLLPVIKT